MKQKILILLIPVLLLSGKMFSQPFVDLVRFNYQSFATSYKTNPNWKNTIDNYSFGLFFPKEFKNGNTLLIRLNGERINSTITQDFTYSSNLSSVSLALGFQLVSKNKKWKTILMGIPKLASDFKDPIAAKDWQYGGFFLENYSPNEKLKLKVGLYYNREAFGDFFVPLIGVDWKATDKINFYGTLPSTYTIEYNAVKNKLYTGLNFKTHTSSFNLSEKQEYDYVRYDEIQLKWFAEYFVYKKVMLFGEIGCPLGKNPLQYKSKSNNLPSINPIYAPLKNYPIIAVGIVYRIRFDHEKNE